MRQALAWALWEITHPEWTRTLWYWVRQYRVSATAVFRCQELNAQKEQICVRLSRVVG